MYRNIYIFPASLWVTHAVSFQSSARSVLVRVKFHTQPLPGLLGAESQARGRRHGPPPVPPTHSSDFLAPWNSSSSGRRRHEGRKQYFLAWVASRPEDLFQAGIPEWENRWWKCPLSLGVPSGLLPSPSVKPRGYSSVRVGPEPPPRASLAEAFSPSPAPWVGRPGPRRWVNVFPPSTLPGGGGAKAAIVGFVVSDAWGGVLCASNPQGDWGEGAASRINKAGQKLKR